MLAKESPRVPDMPPTGTAYPLHPGDDGFFDDKTETSASDGTTTEVTTSYIKPGESIQVEMLTL